MLKITITSINTRWGDNCPNQAKGVLGNKGKSTNTKAANNKPSCNSVSVNQWVAKRCKRSRAANTPARMAAQAEANAG